MSGRINLSNLSDSLKEHLNSLGLTEEQVNELIEEALVSINEKDIEQDEVVNGLVDKVGELNGLMTTEKGDLVGAINELFQDVDNGKNLIADAIDDNNISKDSTFAAMGEAIGGLNTTITLLNNQINSLTNELAGKVTPAGTANANDVVSGKTFINSTGELITGSMVGVYLISPGTSTTAYTTSNSTVATKDSNNYTTTISITVNKPGTYTVSYKYCISNLCTDYYSSYIYLKHNGNNVVTLDRSAILNMGLSTNSSVWHTINRNLTLQANDTVSIYVNLGGTTTLNGFAINVTYDLKPL